MIAGKFAQDYGVVIEQDLPYTGHDDTGCPQDFTGQVHVSDYGYVGGFYGGCNEALMMVALVKRGPLVVGFNVTNHFFQYKNGIYVEPGRLQIHFYFLINFNGEISFHQK